MAKANQRLEDLRAAIQAEQESVNKALVDVQTARDNAAAAQHDVEVSQQAVKDADAAIAAAQRRFDTFAAATYVNGPSNSYLTATGPKTSSPPQAPAVPWPPAPSRRWPTCCGPHRAGQQGVGGSAGQAEGGSGRGRGAVQPGRRGVRPHRRPAQVRRATGRSPSPGRRTRRGPSQARGGPHLVGTRRRRRPRPRDRWDPGGPATARPSDSRQWDGEWDPTLPMVPSANVPGDPIAIINTVLGISATSSQVTANMGRSFLQKLGILKPNDTGSPTGASRGCTAGRPPNT
ncbi:putative cell wall-associated hydrolase [Mycobacterium xenopi 3993]|nr:putative cell wall-associated hydrolase [Mycobacterium xenopi 3993]